MKVNKKLALTYYSVKTSTSQEKNLRRTAGEHKRFYLGEKYPGIYFSMQEARCMKYLLNGLTYKEIAPTLGLSSRTISFYFHNMQAKLKCSRKKDMIEKVKNSDFLKYLDELN